jgi:hypothetical protein
MSLSRALAGAKVIEAAENYAAAVVPQPAMPADERPRDLAFYDDGEFWRLILNQPADQRWDAKVLVLDGAALSEWVPRVPGLFWRPESERLRQYTSDAVEGRDLGGVTLRPFGKSGIVVGGVGTLKLPPSADGHRLGTLTTSANVSTGVPVLIAPDVWDRHRLAEGTVLRMRRPIAWTPLPTEWSSRFPSTRGLPAGCFMLRDPDEIETSGRAGTQIHPFTIMEYVDGASELFDFVFATGITDDPAHRQHLEDFFESYKDRNDRHGRYLIAADVASPLWDAEYASPQELKRASPGAESHLALLERRVRERVLGQQVTREVLDVLCSLPDIDTLRRLSTQIGVPPATWVTGGSLADAAAQFLDKAGPNHLPGLVEKLAIDYPNKLKVA